MKVIARNNGSYKQDAYFNIVREGLIQGKEYTVVKWSYQDNSIALGHWVNRTDNFSNPSKTKFYITI